MRDYKELMDRLLELPSCTLITTGRTGTDFLQSLVDSHPQVLTFNGALFYHSFWNTSLCVAAGNFEAGDLIDEFIGKHIERFKSRYDIRERKDQLGDNCDQSIDIDLRQFRSEAVNLLADRPIDSKNSMVAIYAAYAICLGQDMDKKKLLFHHQHHFEELGPYLKDFPDSKIICMTRDPRANFVSGIENWRKFHPATDQEQHLYRYIKRILADATGLEKYKNEYIVIRLEDLGKEAVLKEFARWLGISYTESLKRSTWGGLTWHGDRVSAAKSEGSGFSEKILQNKWEARLGPVDKYVLNYIMNYRLKFYGYSFRKINFADSLIAPFLILLPLSYELRFFSFGYIRDCFKNREYRKMALNLIFYPMRVGLFLKYYIKVTKKEKFIQPLLTVKVGG